ncbi:DUF2007 domain-containing protein [Comamonas piscis]|uniref:DUF2007 domain-containing protein n=1 Tax=Comamonas piscis TaxID=1562974 RepID=A0A7G5EJQ5_9BURK|nr:DUF2007 domain-containing protein [Comamonas piscis]QMV74230.1 DUF2007 domain-containing protein [Comamonas piscis]WSO32674.1 DUF2007 domain-containing protein [Comamonas piscis]
MRSVYEPANAVQAHVLQDVLRQHGITSFVSGEHLQGAIGELPAGTLLRLLVDDADWSAARRALEDWERAPLMDDDELASADPSLAAQPPAEPAHDSRFDLACNPREGTASSQDRHRSARRWYPCWWAAAAALLALCLNYVLSTPAQPDTPDGSGASDPAQREAGGNAQQRPAPSIPN